MKKVLLLCFYWLLNPNLGTASHIVGGEITLKYFNVEQYQVTLNFYFDLNNGIPSAQDQFVRISFYDKATNVLLDTIKVNTTTFTDLSAESSFCSYLNIRTRHLTYSGYVYMPASKYGGSQGFYASWEECCRNADIINIQNSSKVGSTFYSEFPPVTKHDSSPAFIEPTKNNYACLNTPFSYDFSATDLDGDSLTYELVTPYTSHFDQLTPKGWSNPAPYNNVLWDSHFSLTNAIPGNPPLSINAKSGLIAFTATFSGLYVFAVKCSEYRKGIYLGSVRREFQLTVIPCGRPNSKPILEVINPSSPIPDTKTAFINIDDTHKSCIQLKAIDSLEGQKLTVTPYQFKTSITQGLTLTVNPSSYVTRSKFDTSAIQLCLDSCVLKSQEEIQIILILKNENNCSMPKYDTTNLTLKNKTYTKPNVIIGLPDNDPSILVNKELIFPVYAVIDSSRSPLILYAKGSSFSIKDNGMAFNTVSGIDRVSSNFSFTANCNLLKQSPYKVYFVASTTICSTKLLDSVLVTIHVRDTINKESLVLVNIFTPNGDHINDYFEIPTLPTDNCAHQFVGVDIYNRWGSKVFTDIHRNFQWSASQIPDGLYYYSLRYTNNLTYKNWLEVVR